MISLSIQLKLIIFSFIFGFFFSLLIEWFNKISKNYKNYLKIVLSFILIFIMSLIYFIGCQKISNAIFHNYNILCIVIGYITYDIIAKYNKK